MPFASNYYGLMPRRFGKNTVHLTINYPLAILCLCFKMQSHFLPPRQSFFPISLQTFWRFRIINNFVHCCNSHFGCFSNHVFSPPFPFSFSFHHSKRQVCHLPCYSNANKALYITTKRYRVVSMDQNISAFD